LRQALDDLLARLDEVESEVASWPSRLPPSAWLAGLVLTVVATEIVVRRRQTGPTDSDAKLSLPTGYTP
jgi:hypothetical protein